MTITAAAPTPVQVLDRLTGSANAEIADGASASISARVKSYLAPRLADSEAAGGHERPDPDDVLLKIVPTAPEVALKSLHG